jgi:hypothetical protein
MEVLCGLANDRIVGIIGDRVGQLGKMENTGWEGG